MVRDALELDLKAWGRLGSSDAEVALVLAGRLDDPGTSATAKGIIAKTLFEQIRLWRQAAADAPADDGVDQLASRRDQRRSAA